MTDEIMIAWAAGIYEGEGTTTRETPINIVQKNTWILYKLESLFGGRVSFRINRMDKKTLYVYTLHGEAGRNLLKLFIPYLSPWRIKQIEDNMVLDFYNLETHCRNGHERSRRTTYISPSGYKNCRLCKALNKIDKKYEGAA